MAAARAETWAVTDRAHPLPVLLGVRLIQLDTVERLEAQLSAGRLADPAQVAHALRPHPQGPAGVQLRQNLNLMTRINNACGHWKGHAKEHTTLPQQIAAAIRLLQRTDEIY